MEGKDTIKELFSQKLGNYEAKVNPELWAKISSQVAAGATTTAAATGLSVFAKVAIGLGVSAAAIATVLVLSTNSSEEVIPEKQNMEVQNELSNANKEDKVAEIQNEEITPSTINESVNTAPVTPSSTANSGTPPAAAKGSRTAFIPLSGLAPNQATTVNAGKPEPKIVEGVSYIGMTNYGSKPANLPEISPDILAPQTKPIKNFVNVFTPNGDGQNDIFHLESEGLTDFSVVVLDSKGDIVYQSKDPNFSWDGRDIKTGNIVESGTYMYMVSAYDAQGNPYPIYERLTIVSR